ncbi:hypothetical protein PFISCL1PPCAC_12483, partial [Pristionchus fissidentatus]
MSMGLTCPIFLLNTTLGHTVSKDDEGPTVVHPSADGTGHNLRRVLCLANVCIISVANNEFRGAQRTSARVDTTLRT